MKVKAKVVLTDCAWDSIDIGNRILGEIADSRDTLAGLQSGAPGEVRRVLEGQWPINFVNSAVRGKEKTGLPCNDLPAPNLERYKMKLCRYGEFGAERPAIFDEQGALRDLSGYVSDITPAHLSASELEKLSKIRLSELPLVPGNPRIGAPVSGISKFIAIGLNYRDHAEEAGMAIPTEPIIFMKSTTSIGGPNDDIVVPPHSTKLDWELELGVVIGKKAQYISEEEALDYVAGYCVVNDVSERSFQLQSSQWDKGKGCDTFGPIGPWLVTKDEVPDPQNLNMWLDVNGERRQGGNSRTMIFTVKELVAYCSRYMTLLPGDVITTGTPPGVGMGMKPEPTYLNKGDVVTLWIEGLGTQKQLIVERQV